MVSGRKAVIFCPSACDSTRYAGRIILSNQTVRIRGRFGWRTPQPGMPRKSGTVERICKILSRTWRTKPAAASFIGPRTILFLPANKMAGCIFMLCRLPAARQNFSLREIAKSEQWSFPADQHAVIFNSNCQDTDRRHIWSVDLNGSGPVQWTQRRRNRVEPGRYE